MRLRVLWAVGYVVPGGDQLARLVNRGVGSSLRVMVQHARVLVGASNYHWYHPYMILLLLSCLLCQRSVERDFMRADGDYFFCRVCLTNHGRDSRLGGM